MLLLAAVLAIFVYGIIAAMLGTILPDLSTRFHLSPKQNGNIAMAQGLGLMIGSFFVGPLIDTEGRKAGLLLALAIISIALFALRGVGSYGMIAAMMLLLGVGGGSVVTGAFVLAEDVQIASLSQAGVFNLINLFFGLGGLVTPLIAARLFKNNSSRLLIFAGSLAAVTWVIHFLTAMKPASGQVQFKASLVTGLLSKMDLLLLSLFLFLYVSAEVGVWNWLTRHLIAQGVAQASALTILSLGFALGMLLGRVAISPVLSSVKPEQVLTFSAIFMAVTTFLMLQTKDPKIAGLLVFLAGMAMAPVFPTTLSVVGTRYPDVSATAKGIASTAGWLGLVVSSPIIGSIAGDDPKRLKKALLILPLFAIIMILVSYAL